MKQRDVAIAKTHLQSEARLVSKTASHILAHFAARHSQLNWRLAREIAVGRSIPDLVIVGHDPAYEALSPVLSAQESVFIAQIRGIRRARIDTLAPMYERDPSLHHCVESLIRRQVLLRSRTGTVSLSPEFRNKGRLIAIEAKLTKWRQAVTQATAYLRFADEAYVLLPEATAQRAMEARKDFRTARVGLLAQTAEGVRVLHREPGLGIHDWRREYVYSRAFTRAEMQ